MPISPTEMLFYAAAIVCLVGSTAIHIVGGRWPRAGGAGTWRAASPRRGAEKAVVVLALLCVVAGLGSSAIQRGGWPLILPVEVISASAAAAMLWRLMGRQGHEPKWGRPLLYAMVAGLLAWGIAHGPTPRAASAVDAWQQPWLFASHLALALACGAFVDAGSLGLTGLLAEMQPGSQVMAGASGDNAGQYTALPGLALLTVSMLITALAGQYTRGVAWSWTAFESWQLLAWLFYAIIWCAYVLSGWRGRRIRALTASGLIPTVLMLSAVGP
jgi:ABC-type transport system involved in cytochrome c biogenesis permease subunit